MLTTVRPIPMHPSAGGIYPRFGETDPSDRPSPSDKLKPESRPGDENPKAPEEASASDGKNGSRSKEAVGWAAKLALIIFAPGGTLIVALMERKRIKRLYDRFKNWLKGTPGKFGEDGAK